MRYQVLRLLQDGNGQQPNLLEVVKYHEVEGGNLTPITVKCYTLLSVGETCNGILDESVYPPLLAIKLYSTHARASQSDTD